MTPVGVFLSTLPAWGATGEDIDNCPKNIFLSTLPAWGATCLAAAATQLQSDFYPRSPRGERLMRQEWACRRKEISIHAPRVGSDFTPFLYSPSSHHFYPRSPRGERQLSVSPIKSLPTFLSTLPAWGATMRRATTPPPSVNFYPRSPRGERLTCLAERLQPKTISIHAPRVGSDHSPRFFICLYI